MGSLTTFCCTTGASSQGATIPSCGRSGRGLRLIRRSRGWAPVPVDIDLGPEPILALGAELQNAIALYADGKCYLSQ